MERPAQIGIETFRRLERRASFVPLPLESPFVRPEDVNGPLALRGVLVERLESPRALRVLQRRVGFLALEMVIAKEQDRGEIVRELVQKSARSAAASSGRFQSSNASKSGVVSRPVMGSEPQALFEAGDRPIALRLDLAFVRPLSERTVDGIGKRLGFFDVLLAQVPPDQSPRQPRSSGVKVGSVSSSLRYFRQKSAAWSPLACGPSQIKAQSRVQCGSMGSGSAA